MKRDNLMQSIRPLIPEISEKDGIKPLEYFQNHSLRPILKQQNDLLLLLFLDFAKSRKGAFFQMKELAQKEYIASAIQKDLNFRNILLGTIIGFFSSREVSFYLEHKSAINKRIYNLLIQRLQSQLDLLQEGKTEKI